MNEEEFNKYCAEVMGYKYHDSVSNTGLIVSTDGFKVKNYNFNPATDLNQMAEVFDKLWEVDDQGFSMITLREKGIAQAMREFIESTKGVGVK